MHSPAGGVHRRVPTAVDATQSVDPDGLENARARVVEKAGAKPGILNISSENSLPNRGSAGRPQNLEFRKLSAPDMARFEAGGVPERQKKSISRLRRGGCFSATAIRKRKNGPIFPSKSCPWN